MTTNKPKLIRTMNAKEIMSITGKDAVVKEQWLKLAREYPEVKLFNIAGDIASYGIKPTTNGESVFFTGIFLARNNLTGQMFKASKLYLPSKGDAENLLAAWKSTKGENKENPVIGFSFEYVLELTDRSPTGYSFLSESERAPEQVTREAELLARMEVKALAAPKKK